MTKVYYCNSHSNQRVKEFKQLSDQQQTTVGSDEQTSNILQQDNIIFQTLINKKKYNKNIKSELCKNYLQYGYCRYKNNCQFAHGIQQLQKNQNQNNKYKTKQCLGYFKNGHCSYGIRCNFQHKALNSQIKHRVQLSKCHMLNQYPQLILIPKKRLNLFKQFM